MEDVSAIPGISESVVATAGENECHYPGDSPSPPLPLLLSPADDSDRIALNKCNLNYKTKISLPTKEYRGTIVVEQPHEQMEWEELGEKRYRFGDRVRCITDRLGSCMLATQEAQDKRLKCNKLSGAVSSDSGGEDICQGQIRNISFANLLEMDNTTAVAYINNQREHSIQGPGGSYEGAMDVVPAEGY